MSAVVDRPHAAPPDTTQIWGWLAEIPDPEIPVISVVDLGIVRDVAWQDGACVVTITPTYSGCPATEVIGADITRALQARGIAQVRLQRQLSPAWTTDWLSDAGREKLHAYGIAPPLPAGMRQVACPRCGSPRTALISEFGSTPCKSLHRCEDCLEPFDHFKCH